MRFFAPEWLWGLLVLPLLYLAITIDERKRQALFSRFADRKLWHWIVPELEVTHRVKKARYALAAAAFALLALARPQAGTHQETVNSTGLDIMLALDVSNSMSTEDVVPSRLQKAKHLIRSLLSQLSGDRVGVVAFAGSTFVACPLTTDLSYLWDTVQILGPKSIQNQGTDIGASLDTAKNALERGGEEVVVAHSTILPSHVVILISDGEDHEEQAVSAAAKFKELGTKLYVLGIGTEAGGPIPIKDENGNSQGFKKDRSGQTVISAFHPDFLQEVAKAADGKYWNITAGEMEVQSLVQELSGLNRSDYAERTFLVYEERFQIPLLIAVLLLLLEISVPARKMKVPTAIWPVLWLGLVLANGTDARASDFLKNTPSLDAYLENKKGVEAYKRGNMEEAQKNFGTAQALDPSRPELEFNEGVISMQKGDVERAVESFKNSARSANQNSDYSLLGKSMYNLGNALAKKGDTAEAIQAFLGAVHSARQSKNQSLEYESRKNLQLLINEAKKQEQQQQEQKQKEEKEKEKQSKDQQSKEQQSKDGQKGSQAGSEDTQKQQQSQQGNEQKKDQEQGKGQKEEPQHYQETPKELQKQQQFRSQKMSPEDADRVMSELTSRERELQEKLQTQNVKSQDNQKDW